APFMVYTVTGLVAAALTWFVIPETRRALAATAVAAAAPPGFAVQVRLLTAQIGFALVSLISFVSAFARTGALFNVIPVLAHDRLGLSAERIGFGLGLASLVGLALIYPSGVLVDRYRPQGRHRAGHARVGRLAGGVSADAELRVVP